MHISRLHIDDFRSFGEGREFALEPGLNAVTGPNGSGKTSFLDAIRGVLCEKAVFGDEDVRRHQLRFGGTGMLEPASAASVSLTFIEGEALDAAQITIARRQERSGFEEARVDSRRCTFEQLNRFVCPSREPVCVALGPGDLRDPLPVVCGMLGIDEPARVELSRVVAALGELNATVAEIARQFDEDLEVRVHIAERRGPPWLRFEFRVSGSEELETEMELLCGRDRTRVLGSLLLAGISLRPPLVLLLDEVGGAFDDEDSGRFACILERALPDTQIVATTHSPVLVERASHVIDLGAAPGRGARDGESA